MDLDHIEHKLFARAEAKGGAYQKAERKKVSERVFDDATVLALYKLVTKGVLARLNGIVSTGKEANVFHGRSPDGADLAVKIYSLLPGDFRKRLKYIRGDPRFKLGESHRKLVYEWARKEHQNLSRVHAKISCPTPRDIEKNVLVMAFIGEDGVPAPKLKDVGPEEPDRYFTRTTAMMRAMYKEGLVHGDLSEYNILDAGEPVLIDFSQGVLVRHEHADEFLRRDIRNICKYFSKHGVDADEGKTYKKITGVRPR